MALSRRDWNNVVIFSMLGMAFLFATMTQRITRELEPGHEGWVLPQPAVILTLQHSSGSIERLGAAWRSVPSLGLPPEQLALYAEQWQSLQATRVAEMPDTGTSYDVSLWVAGEANPRHYLLLQHEQQLFLASSSDIWQLAPDALTSLLPQAWREAEKQG